jgi:hypothetical protein
MEKSKIIERLEYSIDVAKFMAIVDEQIALREKIGLIADKNQLMITRHVSYRGASYYDSLWNLGCGSLWSEKYQRYTSRTGNYTGLPSFFVGTYVEEVIEDVKRIAMPKKIGRVRLLTLLPKTCYSLHIDEEEFRFHIPIQTSHDSFFVSGTTIDRMPEVGQLYTFKTDEEHTAVNASLTEKRTHLVFDTYD